MLQPGRVVDRYVIEAELGSGGMATVYKVRHARLRSVHALKVLKVQGSDLQARLVQEGQMQAQLRHPNIVAVTDVVDVDGAPGLVMDFVAGPPLDAWLREQPRPSLAEALRIFGGIVDAVARAHREGLVHRDLKPGNVLLEDGDRGLVPKVSDFGLAKILADSGSPLTRTRSGVAVGTPQYMAPEQVRDASRVDQRADIFALGCILYELTCGRSPFAHSDLLSTMNAVVAGDFPPPKEVAPGLPENVRAAIEGCLVVDRDRRIPDCATLVGVLAGDAAVERARPRVRVAADEPTSPSSDETLQPASKGTWAAIAVGGGALVAAAGFGTLAIALGAWWWLEAREAGEVAVAAPPPAEVAVAEPEPPPEAVTEPEPAPKRAHHRKRPAPKAAAAPAPPPPSAPVAAAAAPAWEEEPAPEPEAPRTGSVFVDPDGMPDELWLVDAAGGRREIHNAPVGSYTLWARFGASAFPAIVSLEIRAGEVTPIRCNTRTKVCTLTGA